MISLLLAAALSATGAPEAPPAKAPAAPSAAAAPAPAPAPAKAPDPMVELRVPLFSGAFAETPVASVDGEPIRLRELTDVLGETHAAHGMPSAGKPTTASKQDVSKILQRLVTLRVVAAEARLMGMDDIAELKKAFASHREKVARQIVRERATAKVQPDPEEVKALVREATREVKLDSVLFKDKADAEAFRKAVEAGGDFKKLGQEAIAAGKASSGALEDWVKPEKLLPQLLAALEKIEKGKLARSVVATQSGVAVVLLVDERFPEDPIATAQAEETSRSFRRQAELARYFAALTKKHATVDRALVKNVDFGSAKAFRARRNDQRPLARIKGAKPVVVADLARQMEQQFFHGVERRADNKELVTMKDDFFNVLLFDRLLDREAELQGVKVTTEFEDRVGEFERGQLFGKFVERVLVPDVDVKESEALARYEARKADFTTPAMLTLEAVAFGDAKSSKAALDKAQRGAEFRWIAEHSDGRLPADEWKLQLGRKPVALGGLSPELQRSLRGAAAGDYRVHSEGDQHYVIHVVGEVPESVRPYPEVRQEVVNALYAEKLEAALDAYVAKLRETHEVKVYATRIDA
jgi:hypothetical protein